MKIQLEERLAELKGEFEAGQRKLEQLQAESRQLQNTLLRISGAIQVLEEEISKAAEPDEDSPATRENGLKITTME